MFKNIKEYLTMKGITVSHKKYGKGKLVSFNPFLHMIIVFNGGSRRDVRTIATTTEHLKEVTIDGTPIADLVDYSDTRYFIWQLKKKPNQVPAI